MTRTVIDYILAAINSKAAEMHYAVSEDDAFVEACALIDGTRKGIYNPTFEKKHHCAEAVKNTCSNLNLDFYELMKQALEREEM